MLLFLSFQDFRQATLFPTFARSLISDFAVLLSIVIFVGVDMLIGINTPKLVVPSEFKVTQTLRMMFSHISGVLNSR